MVTARRLLVSGLAVGAWALAIACGRSLGEGGPDSPREDAATDRGAPVDAGQTFDGGDPDPVDTDGTAPPPLDDAGCADAAFSESFGFDAGFDTRWSKTVTGGGTVELDGTYVVAPSALRARIDTTASGKAYVARAVCPSSGTIVCAFSLRIDASTEGDIGILDLRGENAAGYGVVRVKAREIMYLSPEEDGGQRVDRTPVPLVALAAGAFHTVELVVAATSYTLKVDGTVAATLPVRAAGLGLDEVRAGILYASGPRAPGWDVRIDELGCRFE